MQKYSTERPPERFKALLRRINETYEIPAKYVEDVLLPVWWKQDVVSTETGFLETARYLAKTLRRPTEWALDPEFVGTIADARVECKTPLGATTDKFKATLKVAGVLAELGLKIAGEGKSMLRGTATNVREEILAASGEINLSSVLEYAWDQGIPVMHLEFAPGNKPHGMVFQVQGRYSIVLSRRKKHEGWLVFDLLHELGHVLLGHLNMGADCYFIDAKIEQTSRDEKEKEANKFAAQVLTGGSNAPFDLSLENPRIAIERAKGVARGIKADPQWVVVASGRGHGKWNLVNSLLKEAWPNQDAPTVIWSVMRERKDWALLGRHERELISRLTHREL